MRLKTIQNAAFFLVLALVTVAFVRLVRDFLQPIFWAAVLAVIFRPVYRWWLRRVRRRASPAALLTTLTILVIVVLPVVLVGLAVSRESLLLYDRIQSGEVDVQAPLRLIESYLPALDRLATRFGIDIERLQTSLSGTAVTVSRVVATQALALGQNALRIGVLFFLMLYVLFFFLRDGEHLMDRIVRAVPLGERRERRLFAKFAEVSRATLKGTLVVGVVQGTLGGLMFALLGIGAPVFWGVLMMLMSLLPAVGPAIVWLPAALVLLATGHLVKALVLVAFGAVVIGLVDNLLRPILVGRDTRLPDYVVLLSTLGGIAVLGISGFIIGPIVAALFLSVWQMFIEEYGQADDVEAVEEAARTGEAPPLPERT